MKEYNRLTVRHLNTDFITITETKQLPQTRESKMVLNRLAELEDKIENGTLKFIYCSIGQRVYRRGFFKGEIDEYIVSNIILDNNILKIHLKHDFDKDKTCYSATVVNSSEIGKTVFLTKAEAEEKLKELQSND